MKGKQTCKILKEIRKQIAEQNDIAFVTSECTYQGDCKGTCPKCEAEVRYLERELERRQYMGKTIMLAGLSTGVLGAFSGCGCAHQTPSGANSENNIELPEPLAGDVSVENILETDTTDALDFSSVVEEDSLSKRDFERPLAGIIAPRDEKTSENLFKTPWYPQGESAMLQFIADNLSFSSYYDQAKGEMKIGFNVEQDGSLSNISVAQGLDEQFDQEVKRVFELMPKWIPAKSISNGKEKTVSSPMEVVLIFPLQY